MAHRLIKNIVKKAENTAKETAMNVLKDLDTTELTKLIEAELAHIIDPLEQEIAHTTSWWVKIRNRMYITVLKNSTSAIVKSVQKQLEKL